MTQKTNDWNMVRDAMRDRINFDLLLFDDCYIEIMWNKQGLLDSIRFINPADIVIKHKR